MMTFEPFCTNARNAHTVCFGSGRFESVPGPCLGNCAKFLGLVPTILYLFRGMFCNDFPVFSNRNS